MFKIKIPNYNQRLYYHTIRHTVENYGKLSHQLWHFTEMLLYVFYVFRFIYTQLSISNPTDYPLVEWDFFKQIFQTLSTDKDYFFGATLVMLFVNAFFLEYDLNFTRVDTYTWGVLYDMVVKQVDAFESARIEQESIHQKPRKIVNLIHKIKNNIFPNIKSYNLEVVRNMYRSKYYPNVSSKLSRV